MFSYTKAPHLEIPRVNSFFRLCRKVELHFHKKENQKTCLLDKPHGFKIIVLSKSLQVFCMPEKAFHPEGMKNMKMVTNTILSKGQVKPRLAKTSSDIVFIFLLNQGKVSLPKKHNLLKIKLQLYLSKLCEAIFAFQW